MNCLLVSALITCVTVRFKLCEGSCRVFADCDDDTSMWKELTATGRNPGSPGKRGPAGPKGQKGDQGSGRDGLPGVKGQKGESGRSVDVEELKAQLQEGPVRYNAGRSMTWTDGKNRCRQLGKYLCLSRELCVSHHGDRRLVVNVVRGDAWVPVLDETNEWFQVGDSQRRTCRTHSQYHGVKPNWGTSTHPKAFRRFLFCCGTLNPNETSMTYHYIGKGATYAKSKKYCNDMGLRLCSSAEVCPGNVPTLGTIQGDAWIAVNDRDNEWIQIGDHLGRTCYIHGKRIGAPSWGTRTNGALYNHVGFAYCCN